MDRALYIAMTGAKHNTLAQASHSNNLANVDTTGFRADWQQARAMPVFGEFYPSRAYSMTERPATDFNDGPMISTGRDLDVAIAGNGFFAVVDQNGEEAYTRRGDLSVTPAGEVINGDGLQVMGEGGPLVLPEFERINIGEDGVIGIRPLGAGAEEFLEIDALKLVNPDLQNMQKGTDGLFRPEEGEPVLPNDPIVQVLSGYREGSNVSAVQELMGILSLSRQFEMQIKMMKSSERMTESSTSLLRLS
ncbi:MAG: flagellar basal body rod protein FlgF [Natronospirillum sp.]|uniref:flagellar basal body rod protein FlgF n=1 Tax=Natronospirillum sp. TaxID=2812955 RepID=UPI0025D73332|nr:flagellar basal body rod protein FlgF [Natronospirillum sp.]MCH8553129.1 flagellar basal body rod protein FlgF [Natronospirillum sp.]